MLGLTNKLYEFSLSQIKQVTPFSKKCLQICNRVFMPLWQEVFGDMVACDRYHHICWEFPYNVKTPWFCNSCQCKRPNKVPTKFQ